MSATHARIRHRDFLEPEVLADPYPLLAELRERESEMAAERTGWVWLLKYDSVAAALRDPRLSVAAVGANLNRLSSSCLAPADRAAFAESFAVRSKLLFYLDPPDNSRLRRLLHGWFTPATVEQLRPRIEAILSCLLSAVAGSQRFDAVERIARPLPAMVIAEILGIPVEDHDIIIQLSNGLTATASRGRLDRRWVEGGRDAIATFQGYIAAQIAERRFSPRSDLLTSLAAALKAGECDERELTALCISVAAGGYETSCCLIANAMVTLFRHQDELSALRCDTGLIELAIEEVIRFESPVQVTARVATEDCTIGTALIRAGTLVECLIGAANRDPNRFAFPDRFDIRRSPNRHLGFGLGHHHCLGFALARMEARIAVEMILTMWPNRQVSATRIDWNPSAMFRRPVHVDVEIR